MRRTTTYSRIRVHVMRASTKALLVELSDGRETWVPISAIDGAAPRVGSMAVVEVADWLLEDRGIDPLGDEDDTEPGEERAPIVAFACRPKPTTRRVAHDTFGEGVIVSDVAGHPPRVVVEFKPPHGRKTILSAKLRDT